MDSVSLSPLDDDLFGHNQDDHLQSFHQATLAYPGSEAENFSVASMAETPTSAVQKSHNSSDCHVSSKISDWAVVTLQRALKDRGIPFHRTDNKAKLINSLMSACHGRSVNTSALPDDIILLIPFTRHNVSTSIKGPAHTHPPPQN